MAMVLEQTLGVEEVTDQKLTSVAESKVNLGVGRQQSDCAEHRRRRSKAPGRGLAFPLSGLDASRADDLAPLVSLSGDQLLKICGRAR
jgi:hypothetical protein